MLFTSERLDKSDNIVNAINHLTINDAGYELSKATASDAQGNITSDPDTVTHTSNVILDRKKLSCRTIIEVSVLRPPANPIALAAQTLLTPAVKKIFVEMTLGNVRTSRTPWQVRSKEVGGTNPGNIGHDCGISETSSLSLIVIIGYTYPPCGLNVIQYIGDIWQSTSPYLRKSNKFYSSIDQESTNNLVAPPIFTEVLGDKLSNSSRWYLYTLCRIILAAYSVNIPSPQFMYLGLSTINLLDKGASIFTTATRVGSPMDVAYGIVPDPILKNTTVRDDMIKKSDYNYKTDFEIWR